MLLMRCTGYPEENSYCGLLSFKHRMSIYIYLYTTLNLIESVLMPSIPSPLSQCQRGSQRSRVDIEVLDSKVIKIKVDECRCMSGSRSRWYLEVGRGTSRSRWYLEVDQGRGRPSSSKSRSGSSTSRSRSRSRLTKCVLSLSLIND